MRMHLFLVSLGASKLGTAVLIFPLGTRDGERVSDVLGAQHGNEWQGEPRTRASPPLL